MKIFEVKFENYRQYKGINTVSLSTDSYKNFTIIQGDNGSGKSNFMNAIIWCLYNDELFVSKNNESRDVINESVLQGLNDDESADVAVTLKIGQDDSQYIFERRITYTCVNGKYYPSMPTLKGKEINVVKGWDNIADPSWIISKEFIPEDLRGFFFFDGEKMDSYFEDTSKVKANVEKIAQIDIIKGAISTLEGAKRVIRKHISDEAPGQNINIEKLNEFEEELIIKLDEKEEVENEIHKLNDEKTEINNYLRNNSDAVVREIEENLSTLKNKKNELVEKQNDNEEKIRNLVADRAPILLSLQAIAYAGNLIEKETERGVLPPNVKDIFLKDLLKRGVCICGNDLNADESCRNNVEKLLLELMPSDVSLDATNGKFIIKNMIEKKNFDETYKNLLENRLNFKTELEELTDKIESKSNELKKYNATEIREKETRRNELDKEISRLNVRKGTIGRRSVEIKEALTHISEVINQATKSEARARNLQSQLDYVDDIKVLMTEIKDSIVDEVRSQLEQKTKEYFFNMIWKKEAFSDVQIIDMGNQYKISVKSEFGRECLGDLSAGEKQVLALSFTAALYSVSGYSVPVIIDTPLGRISGAPRDNIASSLPNYLSETQVIMLMTDTEYTESVREKIKENVGMEYRICHNEEDKTSKVIDYE